MAERCTEAYTYRGGACPCIKRTDHKPPHKCRHQITWGYDLCLVCGQHLEAEAELTRLRKRLLALAPSGKPFYLVYHGDDDAECVFCGSWGGNPYELADIAAWRHEKDCIIGRALAHG